MTAGELRTYLVIRRFDEDVVQDVIVDFITTTIPIRYPKAWGWKAAQRYTAARRRAENRTLPLDSPLQIARNMIRSGHLGTPLKGRDFLEGSFTPETYADERALNPERRAEVREELARAFKQGPPKRKKGRPRNDGFEGCREDYATLEREQTPTP